MYRVKLTINPQVFSAFRDLSARSQREFRRELQTQVKPTLQKQADATFGSDPGPVKYKIDWTSVKQRAAFFASNGFGRGIPTKRTDQLRTSWSVKVSSYLVEHLVTLRNPKGYAKYVYPSPHQQRFHAKTGWGKDFERYTRDFENAADVVIAAAWLRSIRAAMRVRQ